MKIAIISDIHGNAHALEAVLQEIDGLGVDDVIVNGDLVNRGPNNVAVLERLAARNDRWLLGNHDDFLCKWIDRDPSIPAEWFDDPFWGGTAWCARQLADAGWIDRLRELPMTYQISPPGAPTLLISHGSPRHYREGYGEHLTDQQLAEIARLYPADILIGSHTHRPLERVWEGHTILNSGAVGAPFNGNPQAQYLLMELHDGQWSWQFRAVEYNHAAALHAYEESGYLPEGGLSALIFREELRYARSLFTPFWIWAETEGRACNWQNWHLFFEQYRQELTAPDLPGQSE